MSEAGSETRSDTGAPGPLTDLVRSHPAFAPLDGGALDVLLADSRVVWFSAGETLVHQGDESDCALVLLEGTVAVVAQTEFGLATLSELSGVQLLGEVGVYAGLPRSATLLARTPARALRIGRAAMMRLCYDAPEIPLHVIQQLGARLNAFNQAIATYADALAALDADQGDPAIVETLLNPPPELTNFATAFRKMAQFIAQQRQQREEMASAAAIQTALLPFPLPVDPRGRFRLDAQIKPARHVGGDFFDALMVEPDAVVVTMGDVSGKGVPASLFATVCQMVMRLVLADGADLGAALTRANALIASANREGMFATFFVARLDLATGELRFCNAGHVWPTLQRADGTCEELRGNDLPLAVLDDAAYGERRARLEPGDRLILCTDGVTEAIDAAGEEFGQARLVAALDALHGRADDPAAAIVAAVDAFSEGLEPFDDTACLVLHRCA
ncbi:SpoIIE family protein phosphatase [Methylobacterium sp. NEAU 140]|uniref:PP2C family protein-serine/threonine phosphatase n=1 Tax=Methylobacterium sp. NEAU 140 TaxID=3064945 RepID=UPI0027330CFC|nr:SpoIIE family protein phosphatase [Methylobacterium sp. NEAU 140]MDP4025141.1 SpoIIE family protein phosphatase [Methylobacterium sp. NEAU 140]